MRWDALFEDLENQLAASAQLDLEAEISERARVDASAVELIDRLRAHAGHRISIALRGGAKISGKLSHVGRDWLVMDAGVHEYLVTYPAIITYQGLGRASSSTVTKSWARISLASALRTIGRDRAEVQVQLLDGREESQTLRGVLDRVAADHVDLAVLAPGEVRRSASLEAVVTLPLSSVAVVQSLRIY
ncbi:hypothetical protein ACQQCD_01410 [Pseudarthrobacter sp. J1763]|uniref:hypothetical protein n=1 Tax=Pseudarthrobacter sp. J1763 TaxID=3420445 RepID=UPI003D2DD656